MNFEQLEAYLAARDIIFTGGASIPEKCIIVFILLFNFITLVYFINLGLCIFVTKDYKPEILVRYLWIYIFSIHIDFIGRPLLNKSLSTEIFHKTEFYKNETYSVDDVGREVIVKDSKGEEVAKLRHENPGVWERIGF